VKAASPAQLAAFKDALATRFHARIVRREDAFEMRLLAMALDALRGMTGLPLPDFETFLRGYATTIGPLVYLPSGLSPDDEMELVVHEVQHVAQWNAAPGQTGLPGRCGMLWLYLVEPEARVRFEVEANRAAMEHRWARSRTLALLDDLVHPLEGGYALGAAEVTLGRDLLEAAATSVSHGVVSTVVGQFAAAWLAAHAPELLA
jgi:hypothetical protein